VIKTDDSLPFPVFQPEITGNGGVMLVGFAVPFDPGVELALTDCKPTDEPLDWNIGLIAP